MRCIEAFGLNQSLINGSIIAAVSHDHMPWRKQKRLGH